ncbi:MAG: type II secretion system F family protein [Rhodocyclaceae bacterium]|nr:type II secretion system F family protein [Rhodocyclaceae bacterium]
MRFEITAYRHEEGVTTLVVEAPGAEEAAANATGQGYEVVAIRESGGWKLLGRREPPFDLLLFSQELRSLLDAGLSLIESLGALSRKENANSAKRRQIDGLTRQLREGKSFSVALRQFPAVFPPLYLALTSASEQTGDLGGALGRFIDYRGRMDAVKKRVSAATIYPILLLGVGGFVILFLMTYVVPRFSKVYEDLGSDLPLMSRLLLQWGSLIESYGLQMLVVIVVAGVAAAAYFRRRKWGWGTLLRGVLSWPALAAVRERFRAYALARFYRTMGLLLQGGIPVVTALGMARELLDVDMAAALDRALIEVRGGVALSEAMERAHLAPPVASDLLRIGEKAGDMGEKMMRIADFHDDETARWADWFARLFEPLLMLTIGLFVAFIVVLLYMPIFELAGSVQ